MSEFENGTEQRKLDRVLVGEQDLKKIVITSSAALLTAMILTSAGAIWATNNKLKDIEAWQEKHDAHYEHGMEQVVELTGRVKRLEEFANRGDRYTRQDGDKIEARVRLLENTSIRIEAKLDAILDKLGGVKKQLGAPHQ